jgi:hypothetical protein
MAIIAPIFKNLTNDQQHSMQASYIDFFLRKLKTGVIVGNTNGNSLTPLSEVLISLRRFLQNALSVNKSLLPFHYLFLSASDKNTQTTYKIFCTLKKSAAFFKLNFT